MARGDRRGPEGKGPMTGRGAGYCSGSSVPGYMNRAPQRGQGMGLGMGRGCRSMGRGGRGKGFGRGFGQGWGDGFAYAAAPADEREMLKGEAESMKKSLEIITARLKELEKEDSKS